jgi:4-hydroxybenzoate polyprenyltransferase
MSVWTATLRRLDAYERLVRLDKPIGSLLLLWPTLTALWIAGNGAPRWSLIIIFTLGTVLMRSAGCAVNDWADRDFDAHVARTRRRPLAAREIEPWEALAVAAVFALLALMLIVSLNALTLWLSVVAVLIAVSYPFAKRFISLPQAYLGIAFSFGIPMAFAAQTNGLPSVAWVLLIGNFFWIMAYDTEYALADYPDDLAIGIRTSAITFGDFAVKAVMISYAIALFIFAAVGYRLRMGPLYYVGLVAAGALAIYHYTLIRGRDRDLCFRAFLHNTWFGLAVFAGVALDYAIRLRAWPTRW